MAKPELGTKRIDPETGRKFYDLNKEPIVSPYTGKTYPRSFFESSDDASVSEDEDIQQKELDGDAVEVVSLEDADNDVKVDDDVDLGDDDDTFLEDEEEEDDDVVGIINLSDDEDEI